MVSVAVKGYLFKVMINLAQTTKTSKLEESSTDHVPIVAEIPVVSKYARSMVLLFYTVKFNMSSAQPRKDMSSH